MQFIVTSTNLLDNLVKLKLEVQPSPVLALIEEFLFVLRGDDNISPKARKARLKSAVERLKELKSSKALRKLKSLVLNTKYLRQLKNFFSYSSRTNNVVIIRRILLKLSKKSPEEGPAIYLLSKSNSFSQPKFSICQLDNWSL